MRLRDRIGLLIRAQVGRWLRGGEDKIETALRRADEMEVLLEHLGRRLNRAQARVGRLEGQIRQARAETRRWESRADEALRRGDEAAAREAIRQKMAHDRVAEVLESSLSRQRTAAQELTEQISELESHLDRADARSPSPISGSEQVNEAALPNQDEDEILGLDALRERMSRTWSGQEIEEELNAIKRRLSSDLGKGTD
jgi:chromosome segregation ATPase